MAKHGMAKQATRREFIKIASLAGGAAAVAGWAPAAAETILSTAMPAVTTTAKGDQPMSEPLSIIARMYVREGDLEGFKRQVGEITRQTKEKDTGTFRYDWYLRDEKEAWILEEYASSEAWMQHRENVGEALETLFRDYADGHNVLVFGEPSAELFEAGNRMMAGRIQWFSFHHGLDS